ncbi:Conserved_hypothetical protein [Hexamita inflata]|uniref:Uncharacterized protein n=1 Tax=Hexamita inflata TaxID=28002 RepID=A0ABP1HNW1_9EUKA
MQSLQPEINQNKKIFIIAKNTQFTDQNIKDATNFTADNFTIEQVDKVPTCAVSIKMVNCSLCSCKGLGFHQSLTHLDLSKNFLKQVSGLEHISGLEYVDFSNNFITDISVLAGKNKLKVLKISNNMIFSLEVVSSLPSLQELDYTNNHVYNMKAVLMHHYFKPAWISQQKVITIMQCMQILCMTKEEATLLFNEAENNKTWQYIAKMILKYRDLVTICDKEVSLCISNDQEYISLFFIKFLNITNLQVNMCNNVFFHKDFSQGFQKIKHLFVSNSKVQILQGIQNLKQLETLVLRNNGLDHLPDELNLISELTNLRSLNIAQNGLEDLNWLKLNQLESLDVSENRVKDISTLAEFKDLKNLDISFNLVESVEALRDLVQIEQLNISHNKINNINCLNKLEKLVYFNITCNRIISVEVCLSMKHLVDFRTDQNAICDIDNLMKHQNHNISWVAAQDEPTDAEIKQYFDCDEAEVQRKKKFLLNQKQQSIYYPSMILKYKSNVINDSLEISNDNEMQSIHFSDLLKVMHTLKVSGCQNISFEPHSTLVQHLIVQNCKLDKILNLEQMTQLVSLDLSVNQLKYVLELGELVKLKTLILRDNRIARIDSWIQNLKYLEHLDMQNNKLILVKQLLELPLLKTVLLQGNMIRDIEFLKRHRKYNQTWIQPQNIPTTKDYEYYLGDNRDDKMVLELIQQIDLERYSLQKADKYKDSIQEEELSINNDSSLYDLGFLDPQNEFLQKNTKILTVKFCSEVQTLNAPNILVKLTINNCELAAIKGLERVLNLTHLDLSSNQLTEISALQTLLSLEELVLNNNMIIRIDCLDKLVNMNNLEIKNNRLFNANVLKFWKNIKKLFVNDNFINDFTELFNHDNYNPLWISPQKIPGIEDVKNYLGTDAIQQNIDIELTKYNTKQWIIDKRNLDLQLQKLRMQIQNNQLEIIDNKQIQYLNFVNSFNLVKFVIQYCRNVKFDYICNVKILHVTNCGLSKIDGIQKMLQLQELNLKKNNLIDVTVLGNLIHLQTLILNDNKIRDLCCLKSLIKLEQLNIRGNKITNCDFILEMRDLKHLYLEGNTIYSDTVKQHPNYNNWLVKQRIVNENNNDHNEHKANKSISEEELLFEYIIDRQYSRNMIQIYHTRIKTYQITVENVSQSVNQQIFFNIKNCDFELDENNFLIQCTQENIKTILHQLQKIGPNLRTIQEPLRSLQIVNNVELDQLGFINDLNLGKINIQRSYNVNFTQKINVKVVMITGCQLQNLEGIQNWTEARKLYLYQNNLTYIEQLKHLTNLEVLVLSANKIQNVEPLRELVKLTELDLRVNFIKDFSPISKHPNYLKYYIDMQQ